MKANDKRMMDLRKDISFHLCSHTITNCNFTSLANNRTIWLCSQLIKVIKKNITNSNFPKINISERMKSLTLTVRKIFEEPNVNGRRKKSAGSNFSAISVHWKLAKKIYLHFHRRNCAYQSHPSPLFACHWYGHLKKLAREKLTPKEIISWISWTIPSLPPPPLPLSLPPCHLTPFSCLIWHRFTPKSDTKKAPKNSLRVSLKTKISFIVVITSNK